MIKAATFLLVALAVLAMFGGLRLRGRRQAKACPRCTRPLIGKGPCGCSRPGGRA